MAMSLAGCGIFADRSTEYREAGVIEPIRLPEGVSAVPLESAYEIPSIEVNEFDYIDESDELVVPRPAPMSQDSEYARVKIQKVGERRWVLAEAPTSQVWPLVQSFLARNGILVASAKPKTGEIETGWLTFKVDAQTKSRYRVRIEKGVRDESSEVHVLHQQIAGNTEVIEWPVESSNTEREAWLLDELAVSIAEGITNRAASLLGQSVGGADKIVLQRIADEPVLDIRLDRERAQATLSHALNQEGLKLWQEDAESGLYYFGYDDPNDEPGFWKKMTFRGNDDLPEEAPATLADLLANMSPSSQSWFGDIAGFSVGKKSAPQGYLLRAKVQGDVVRVRVRGARGESVAYPEAKLLMIVIRRNLI